MSAPPRRGIRHIVASTLWLWLSMAVASLALWPIYQDRALLIVVATSLVLGSGVAILGAVFRWPSPVVIVVTLIGFVLTGVAVAVPTKAQYGVIPTLQGLIDLMTGIALGWKQLVTISLPVGSYEALLVPAFVLTLTATVVGLSVALRAARPEWAVLAPVAVFLVATAIGSNYLEIPALTSVALLVTVLLWLVWMRWVSRRESIRALAQPTEAASQARDHSHAGLRTALGATGILAVATIAALGATTLLPPAQDRTVVRSVVEPQFDPRNYVSPLAGFRNFWKPATSDAVLFTVAGLVEGRLRLATMDSYDGVVFAVGSEAVTSQSGAFGRVPTPIDRSETEGKSVELAVEVGDYSGVWVPTLGALVGVEFDSDRAAALSETFFYNETTGTAATIAELQQGDSYLLRAVIPDAPTPTELGSLTPGTAVVPGATGVPDELVEALDGYVDGIERPGERLQAALDGLAREGYISHGLTADEPASRSGHASDRIAELFTASRMIGDAEQYAVAAALMARELGFASRVVLGFVVDGGEMRGTDVAAWIEVNTAQFGWVALDATPPVRDIPEEIPEQTTQVARPPTIVPPPVIESENIDHQTTPESEQELPPDSNPLLEVLGAVLRIAGWVVLGLALLISPFLLIIAAKARRRSLRRRAPTPTDRVSGGWREFEDAVIDHGLSPVTSATRSEIAAVAGGTQSQVLAAVADRAVFAPENASEGDADHVWHAVDELRASLDSPLTRWQRLKVRTSLRSLGGYSVKKLFGRTKDRG